MARFRAIFRRSGRRAGAWLTAALAMAYLCVSLGAVPSARLLGSLNLLPLRSPAFPCQGGGCGCATAERCWTSCCCGDVAEHWAWAREHGVRPPETFMKRARAAGLERVLTDRESIGQEVFATLSPADCRGMPAWAALGGLPAVLFRPPGPAPMPVRVAEGDGPLPPPEMIRPDTPTPPPRA